MSYTLHSTKKDVLYLLLPGASVNTTTGLVRSIFDRLVQSGKTVLAVNFGFQDRQEEKSSGPELLEEQDEVLKSIGEISRVRKWQKIVIVAKSLGGVVASKLLTKIKKLFNSELEVIILGCLVEDIADSVQSLVGRVIIIQGENDKYGTISELVKKYPLADVVTIANADHSYRNENKEPVFENIALHELFLRL